MSGKGAEGLLMGKNAAANKDKEKKKPISRSPRTGLPDERGTVQTVEIASTKEAIDMAATEELISISEEPNSSPISERLEAIKENLESLCSSNLESLCSSILFEAPTHSKTPLDSGTPLDKFDAMRATVKKSIVQEYLAVLNTGTKEELMKMKGIGEKRAECILQLREDSLEPFKELSDLKKVGLSVKLINYMLRKVAGDMFN